MWLSILPSVLLLAQRAPRAVEDEWSRDVMRSRSSDFVNQTMDHLQFPASCVPSHDLVYEQHLPLHVHAAFTHLETLLTLKSLGGERMRAAVAQGALKPWWIAAAVGVPPLLLSQLSPGGVRVGVLSSDLKLSHPIGQLLLPIIDAFHHAGGMTTSCLVIRRVGDTRRFPFTFQCISHAAGGHEGYQRRVPALLRPGLPRGPGRVRVC